MNAVPHIRKENPNLPDTYGLEIILLSGHKIDAEIASHAIINTVKVYCLNGDFVENPQDPPNQQRRFRFDPSPSPYLEYVTKDDEWRVIPMSSIGVMNLDKAWSKALAIRRANMEKSVKKNSEIQ